MNRIKFKRYEVFVTYGVPWFCVMETGTRLIRRSISASRWKFTRLPTVSRSWEISRCIPNWLFETNSSKISFYFLICPRIIIHRFVFPYFSLLDLLIFGLLYIFMIYRILPTILDFKYIFWKQLLDWKRNFLYTFLPGQLSLIIPEKHFNIQRNFSITRCKSDFLRPSITANI